MDNDITVNVLHPWVSDGRITDEDFLDAGSKSDIVNISEDAIDRLLDVIDSNLGCLSPPVGTVRELSDSGREISKLGLEVVKTVLYNLIPKQRSPRCLK